MAIGVAPHVTHQSIQCIHSMLMCASCSSFVACGSWPLHLFSASSFWACVLKGRPPPMATSYVVWVLSLNAKSWIVVVSIVLSLCAMSCQPDFFYNILWCATACRGRVPNVTHGSMCYCYHCDLIWRVWPPMAPILLSARFLWSMAIESLTRRVWCLSEFSM